MRSYAIALGCVLTTSCATSPEPKQLIPSAGTSAIPGEHGTPQFCIAFSGGGIRSGAVSLGALQRLHETGLLYQASYITAVSGGGYPLYGVLDQITRNGRSVRELLDESEGLPVNGDKTAFIMDLYDGVGNSFVGLFQGLSNRAFDSLFPDEYPKWSGLTRFYGETIHHTFSSKQSSSGQWVVSHVPLADTADSVAREKLPDIIFLTSRSDGPLPPANGTKYSPNDLFELAPNWIGSQATGYWKNTDGRIELWHVITSSGGAIDAPVNRDQPKGVPTWLKQLGWGLGSGYQLPNGEEVFLSDGGFIDNQGISPLLHRRCQEILAIDASHDPRLKYRDWWALDGYLDPKNEWKVEYPEEWRRTRNGNVDSAAWNMSRNVFQLTVNGADWASTIYVAKLGASHSLDGFPYEVQHFARKNWNGWGGEPSCKSSKLRRENCAFPQQSTSRQTFEEEEFRAYRFMGKYLVDEFLALRSSHQLQP